MKHEQTNIRELEKGILKVNQSKHPSDAWISPANFRPVYHKIKTSQLQQSWLPSAILSWKPLTASIIFYFVPMSMI